jgi:hypothetical protein
MGKDRDQCQGNLIAESKGKRYAENQNCSWNRKPQSGVREGMAGRP